MAKVVVKSKVKKAKRKYPVQIIAPEFLNSKNLGNSQVTDLNTLVGKTSKLNMMYITGNVKNQNVRLTFIVETVNSGLAKTAVKTYEHIPYYLGRFVKPGSSLVEDSFTVTSKDGRIVRIKPFIVTKMKASALTCDLLRSNTREILSNEITSKTYDEFMATVFNGNIQTSLRNSLKKFYPLKAFELRRVGFE